MDNKVKIYEILVPTMDNNRKPFSTKYHRVWDKKVYEIAKGLPTLSPTKGKWKHDEIVYGERNIPVRVACIESQIADILKMTKKYYNQSAIVAYVISQEVIVYFGE